MNITTLHESWSEREADAAFQEITRRALFQTSFDASEIWAAWQNALRDTCRTTKQKGDVFERLCVAYMREVAHMHECWLLEEVPQEVREALALRKNDFGIDIVCRDAQGNYHAVQAKFRSRTGARKVFVPWRELSTFDALCQRSGPYSKYWVLTSADGIRRVGRRSAHDKSVCAQSWAKLGTEFWTRCAKLEGTRLGSEEIDNHACTRALTMEELRAKRLARLE